VGVCSLFHTYFNITYLIVLYSLLATRPTTIKNRYVITICQGKLNPVSLSLSYALCVALSLSSACAPRERNDQIVKSQESRANLMKSWTEDPPSVSPTEGRGRGGAGKEPQPLFPADSAETQIRGRQRLATPGPLLFCGTPLEIGAVLHQIVGDKLDWG